MKQKTLVENLYRVVEQLPTTRALHDRGCKWSYQIIWRYITAVSHQLRERGVQQGDRVLILLPNGLEYILAYYGILHAGAVAVPMSAGTKVPAARYLSLLTHAKAMFVEANCASTFRSQLGEQCELVQTSEHWLMDLLNYVDTTCFKPVVSENDLAVINFTSGTTGNPKGVMLSHGNLVANTRAINQFLKLTPRDMVANVLPFNYSFGASILHSHLSVGAAISLEHGSVFSRNILEQLKREEITGFAGVPSTYAMLFGGADASDIGAKNLRYMLQAGAHMPQGLVAKVQQCIPHADFFSMYGQTEATARITYLKPQYIDQKIGSVGQAIAGVVLEVRDIHGRRCDAYETGEVYVSGASVMLGYWDNPEETARVLKEGWLATGDIGYLDEEDFLFLKGRRDDMMKIGGIRIMPVEIEEVLMGVDGVAEAAVVALDMGPRMGKQMKAYIVLADDVTLLERDVLRHCSEQLPLSKLPKRVEIVDALPMTENGKLCRAALVERDEVQYVH